MNHLEHAIEHFNVSGKTASVLVGALIACELFAHERQPSFKELVEYLVLTEGLNPRCSWEICRYLCDTGSPQLEYIQRPAQIEPWEPSAESWRSPLRQEQEGAA